MRSGFIRHLTAAVICAGLCGAALAAPGDIATADPNQDQKFFDLLGEKDIPPVDGENGLVTTAHKVCSKLDDGTSVDDIVELIRNNGFNENPLTRLQPQGRVTRTIDRFVTAAVEAYCPNNRGKIASIAAYRPGEPAATSRLVLLTSYVGPVPAGDIAPTKPLPVPVQQMPLPQEVQPAPQAPPQPPRRVQKVPQQAPKEVEPPPEQAPPADAPPPPQVESPAPAAPAPPPPEPPSQTPDQPSPPGHVRLAP
jgi:hypothetical protein